VKPFRNSQSSLPDVVLIDMEISKLKKHGYLPSMATMSKIIYDKGIGNMLALFVLECECQQLTVIRHFSGFSRADRTDTNEEWHDKYLKDEAFKSI
jgi:hypothetical protein